MRIARLAEVFKRSASRKVYRFTAVSMNDFSPFDMTAPPLKDRDLSPEDVASVLREQFPHLELRTVSFLGSGWERDVYLVDDRWVLHFPRYGDVAKDLDRHVRILDLVHGFVGSIVKVPRIELWGQPSMQFPHRFFGHELIPGRGADEVEVPRSAELAIDMGRTLSRIHSIPLEAARAVGIQAADEDCRAPLMALVQQVDQLDGIRQVAPDPIKWLYGPPMIPVGWSGPPRFLHNDLSAEHVLVGSESGRLSGIIDWSGAALGDPSLDFSYVHVIGGLEFLEMAMKAYSLPVDEHLLDRAVFRARVRALGWLAEAVYRGRDTAHAMKAVGHAFS